MQSITPTMTELERQVVETLAGGRTRSALELVTELRVAYEDVIAALTSLVEQHALTVVREDDGEVFYELVAPLPAAVAAAVGI